MSSPSEAFDAPVPFNEYGLDLSFPKLDLDDHAAWCRDLHAARKPAVLKLIPGNAQPTERFKMQRAVEYDEPTLDQVADLLYTPGGARDCLTRSLRKAGRSAEEALAIVKRIPPGRAQRLAMDVSGLYERVPPPLPDSQQQQQGGGGKGPDPLAQTPAASGSDPASTPATGGGSGSSSASTSASPSAP